MRKKNISIIFGTSLIILALTAFIMAEFGKLPPGAIGNSKMGKTSEIALWLVFDPTLVMEKIPKNLRLMTLGEIAKDDQEIDNHLKSHPEHKEWVNGFFEIMGTESLIVDDRTAEFGAKGGMAVWYVLASQRDPKDSRARESQFLALGTWLSDHSLAAYARSRGLPWEDAEIEYWKDKEGLIQGHLKTTDFEVHAACRLQGKPFKPEIKLPAYQTIWSPLPYPNSFEVVTFYGHRIQDCSAEWKFKGNHPLIKTYHSRAIGNKFISGSVYAWDYVLQGALYLH
jgi:hypothetical protein